MDDLPRIEQLPLLVEQLGKARTGRSLQHTIGRFIIKQLHLAPSKERPTGPS